MADDAGALLVRAGLITAEHLAAARAAQVADGGTVGEHLVTAGVVDDERLTEFYRTRLLVPQVHPNTLARLSPSIIALLPADLAAELRAVPVALDKDGNLTVAMSDPSDRHAVDEIGFFTGHYVVRAVATQMQIAWCLASYYDCLTELGERLLQPAAAPAAPPSVLVPTTIAPIVARGGDTGRIEAARHKVLAPVTRPPPTTARPSGAALDHSAPAIVLPAVPAPPRASAPVPAPAPAPVPAPPPAPLPAGAFGGDTPQPPPSWQAPVTAQAPATGATQGSPPAAVSAAAPASQEPASEVFDDYPSIVISADAGRPTRLRPALPDPPELAARAGELRSSSVTLRSFDAPTVSVEINFGDEPEPERAPPAAVAPALVAAPAAPSVAPAPAPANERELDDLARSSRSRTLSEPVIEMTADEPPEPIAMVAAPDADTTRVSAPALTLPHGPPEVPLSDAIPEPIGEAAPEARDNARDADDHDHGPAMIHAPRLEVDGGPGLASATEPAAIADADDEPDSGPILLVTPRRSGAMATLEPPSARPQAVVVDTIDDASGPVLLTERKLRREARRREKGTMIGIGPIPRSAEPTPSPYTLAHAAPEVIPDPVPVPAPASAAVPTAFGDDTATVRTKLRFEEHEELDDGWGPPGSTIPPDFLGAVNPIDDAPSAPVAAPVATSPAPHYTPWAEPGAVARPAATLTPANRNRAVAGVPDPANLAALLEQASQRLVELLHGFDGATHRDHVIAMLVDFVGEAHHRVAFLALRGDELVPFMQVPEPSGPPARLELRHAATFQDVIGTRLPYRGPISDPASRELVRALFGSATDEMLVVPVAVRDRVVGVIYADGRHRHSFDEHVTVASRAAGLALQRILKDSKA